VRTNKEACLAGININPVAGLKQTNCAHEQRSLLAGININPVAEGGL
jgi:hypothetical protein